MSRGACLALCNRFLILLRFFFSKGTRVASEARATGARRGVLQEMHARLAACSIHRMNVFLFVFAFFLIFLDFSKIGILLLLLTLLVLLSMMLSAIDKLLPNAISFVMGKCDRR